MAVRPPFPNSGNSAELSYEYQKKAGCAGGKIFAPVLYRESLNGFKGSKSFPDFSVSQS